MKKQPPVIDYRSNEERHRVAAKSMSSAVVHIERAVADEGNLEWEGSLKELLQDAIYLQRKLTQYSERTNP